MQLSARYFASVLALVTWAFNAAAAPLAHQVELRPKKIQLGQTFEYEVLLSHAQNEIYDVRRQEWPQAFELVDVKRERQELGETSQTRFVFKLASFELGSKEIPPLTFDVASPQGASDWTLPASAIECVASLDENTNEFADIRPPEEVMVPSWRWVFWSLGGMMFVTLAVLFAFWLRKRLKRKLKEVNVLAPHEQALLSLESLRRENLPKRGQVREFHFRWSEILREYLGKRFGFDAMECTSWELFAALEKLPEAGPWLEVLRAFFDQADIARYAKAPVSIEACEKAAEFAEKLIRQTSSFFINDKP